MPQTPPPPHLLPLPHLSVIPAQAGTTQHARLISAQSSKPPHDWAELAVEALWQEPGDEEGWVQIAQLEQRLRQSDPDWSPAHEGAEALLDQRKDPFESGEGTDDGDNVLRHWVRLAPTKDL